MKAFHEVRNYNSDLMVWYSGYENISFVAHWQKEIELVYIRSGEASFHVADQSFTAHAGDLVVCESGQIHYSDSYNTKNHLDFLIFDTNLISFSDKDPEALKSQVQTALVQWLNSASGAAFKQLLIANKTGVKYVYNPVGENGEVFTIVFEPEEIASL